MKTVFYILQIQLVSSVYLCSSCSFPNDYVIHQVHIPSSSVFFTNCALAFSILDRISPNADFRLLALVTEPASEDRSLDERRVGVIVKEALLEIPFVLISETERREDMRVKELDRGDKLVLLQDMRGDGVAS